MRTGEAGVKTERQATHRQAIAPAFLISSSRAFFTPARRHSFRAAAFFARCAFSASAAASLTLFRNAFSLALATWR